MTVSESSELTSAAAVDVEPWPARTDRRRPTRPQISVVVPTYNEALNLPVLLDRLDLTLSHLDYEVVVVDDDSPDLTWQVAEDAASRSRRIRVLRRIGRRGLSSAVLEGLALAQGQVLAVLDADLQHDESVLPAMVEAVRWGGADICVASRDAEGGSYGSFGPGRRAVSWAGAELARTLLGVEVSDPMSGFFALSRERYLEIRSLLTGRGFKVLLEVLVRGRPPVVAEVGYAFRERAAGSTKIGPTVLVAYLASLAELAVARLQATELPRYALLALVGAAVRASLWSMSETAGPGPLGRLAAVEAAIVVEYLLHDRCTFVDLTHRGRGRWAPFLRFHLVCGYGLAALAGMSPVIEQLLRSQPAAPDSVVAPAAGLALASASVMAVVVASYLLNSLVTWPSHRRR
jgi:dolichol-phosphate mannosyltransferase